MEGCRTYHHIGAQGGQEDESTEDFDILFDLHDISTFLPRIVPGNGQHSVTDLTVDPNMLSMAYAKQTVDEYKEMFGVILSKTSITSLSIHK